MQEDVSAAAATPPEPDPPLEDLSAAAATQLEPDPPYWRVVGDDDAKLREAPSLSASIVRELAEGEVATNLDEEAIADELHWRRVADGPVEGWIAAELLEPQGDEDDDSG